MGCRRTVSFVLSIAIFIFITANWIIILPEIFKTYKEILAFTLYEERIIIVRTGRIPSPWLLSPIFAKAIKQYFLKNLYFYKNIYNCMEFIIGCFHLFDAILQLSYCRCSCRLLRMILYKFGILVLAIVMEQIVGLEPNKPTLYLAWRLFYFTTAFIELFFKYCYGILKEFEKEWAEVETQIKIQQMYKARGKRRLPEEVYPKVARMKLTH